MPRNSKSNTAPSLSDLTVDQILSVMRPKGQVLAVGKYQAIPATFKAWIAKDKIPGDATFDAQLQERLGDYLVGEKRPKVAQFVRGSSNVSIEEAQLELAKEFASIPVPYRIYRKPGTAGRQDAGGWVEAGQSYYYGVAGNRATASSEKYQNALRQARSQNSFAPLKEFIARGEGNYDSLNRGVAGDTSIYSQQYYDALAPAGSTPVSQTPQTTSPTPKPTNAPAPVPRPPVTQPILGPSPQQPLANYTEYIEKIYKNPFKQGTIEVQREILYTQTNASEYFRTYLGNLRGVDYSKNDLEYLVALDKPELDGDILLIDSLIKKQEKQKEETKTILDGKLGAFSPDAKLMLITSALFEMYPDDMRNKMSINSAKDGVNPNYSHAWRAPGKVSITADFTIPGISGLRVGQIFWIDKISDAYKEYGAFQLFGLTENIDISKGWTTSIHSRFNVLPRNSGGGKRLIDETTAVNQVTQVLSGISSVF